MKTPRDLSGRELAKAMARLGYAIDHQTGSHIRLTTQQPTVHHITLPDHDPIKIGTLNNILRELCDHAKLDRAELLRVLFEH